MTHLAYSGKALRRGALHYLTGKAVSALLTFVILLCLIRLLSLREYGVYVALVAGAEIAYAVGGLGLPWLAARYLPEYRLNAPGEALIEVCRRMLIWQALAFAVLVGIFFLLSDYYFNLSGLRPFSDISVVLMMTVLFEGLGRFVREPIMGSLILQRDARLSLICRQLVFLLFLIAASAAGSFDVFAVAAIEAGASMISFCTGLWLLERHLKVLRPQAAHPAWQAPTLRAHWAVALRMYFAHLVSLTYSPQVLTNVVMRMLGSEAAALFGFLRALNDQVARYLPATLLFSLIRPKLMASYAGGGGMAELTRNANLAGKLSLFVLVSLLSLAALSGDMLVDVLSGDKFGDTGWLLTGFLAGLIPFSQRQLLESVVVAIGRAEVCVWASASGLVMLPLTWFLIHADFGLWAPVMSIGIGHLTFNGFVLGVVGCKYGYRADWSGVAKMFGCAVLSYLILVPLSFWLTGKLSAGWMFSGVQAVLAVGSYLILAWVFKPFSQEERNRINAFLRRRVFIW